MKNQKIQAAFQKGDTKEALRLIDANSFLTKNRNKLLFYFEKGKAAFLDGDYKLSNQLFNEADRFIEEQKKYMGGRVVGVLLNPEQETYLGEDFEKVAIHYYKALNYIFLNEYDDALVEAKRINLQLQQLNDEYSANNKNRYNTDAFALNMQGMLYEASGDVNNAFISYRNSVDVYLKNKNVFFGTTMPKQLKQDLLRTASAMGFRNEVLHYEKILNTKLTLQNPSKSEGGELILFWENGVIPYKDQTFFTFAILPGGTDGVVHIHNEELGLTLPIPMNTSGDKSSFASTDVFNVAYPKYVHTQPYFVNATVSLNGKSSIKPFELGQNYDVIAFETLKDRTLREIGKVAVRLAVKKMSEYVVKNQNADIGAALSIFNALSERADTRNWQSLPNKIYYTRIPLQKGENTITVQISGVSGNVLKKEITAQGKGGIQFQKIITMQSTK